MAADLETWFEDTLIKELNELLAAFFCMRSVVYSIGRSDVKIFKGSPPSPMGEVCLRLNESTEKLSQGQATNDHSSLTDEIQSFIADFHTAKKPQTISRVFIDKVSIVKDKKIVYFKLNRLNVFKYILPQVLTCGDQYGIKKRSSLSCGIITICPVCPVGCVQTPPKNDSFSPTRLDHSLSMEDGRVLLVSKLLASLLSQKERANLQSTENLHCPHLKQYSKMFFEVLSSIAVDDQGVLLLPAVEPNAHFVTGKKDTMTCQPKGVEEEEMFQKLKIFVTDNIGSGCGSLTVDGKRFIYGRDYMAAFSKNIRDIEVKKDSSLTQVAKMALSLYSIVTAQQTKCNENVTIILVTSQKNSFRCQQAIILVLMCLSSEMARNTRFQLLEVGSVTCVSAAPILCVEDYVSGKKAEIKRACEVKYGEVEKDSSLKHIVSRMTNAAVKFDFLATEPRKTLKLEMEDNESLDARSEGVFVLYNYARLSTLVLNYEEALKKGSYPLMPDDFNQIDYSLLTNQEEWNLVYSYVALFPSVLEEAGAVPENGNGLLTLTAYNGLKKICQFLCRLCHDFSCYYSRVKILLGPEPHLVPLIQARMALILALKQVLHNGLLILGIEPLTQL